MRYLIDTHILLWLLIEPGKLSPAQVAALDDADEVLVSSISFWEISLKYHLGKLALQGLMPDELPACAEKSGLTILETDVGLFATFHTLPKLAHKDPFDRLIVHAAIRHDLILVSRDASFTDYQRFGLKLL